MVFGCFESNEPEIAPDAGSDGQTAQSLLGRRMLYEVSIHLTSEGSERRASPQSAIPNMDGVLSWSGDVLVSRLAELDGRALSELSLVSQKDFTWSLMTDAVPFVDLSMVPPVRFLSSQSGEIQRIHFGEEHDLLIQNLVHAFLAHGWRERPRVPEASWKATGRDLFGEFRESWRRSSTHERVRFSRTIESFVPAGAANREGQDASHASGRFEYDFNGPVLERAIGKMSVEGGGASSSNRHVEIRLKWKSETLEPEIVDPNLFPVRPIEGEWGVPFGSLHVSKRIREGLLRQKASTITAEDIKGYAATFGTLGKTEKHFEIFYQAVAFVQLHDSVAKELADTALEPETSVASMGFLADVLVGAETEAAQRQLMRILNDPKVRESKPMVQAGMLMRVGFIEEPLPALAAHAMDRYAAHGSEDSVLGETAAMTLGSVVYHGSHLDEAWRTKANEALRRATRSHEGPVQRNHILALANTRLPENFELVASLADSPSFHARAAVATALSSFSNPKREPLALKLASDGAMAVQGTALRALAEIRPSSDGAAELVQLVRSRKVADGNLMLAYQAMQGAPPELRDLFFQELEEIQNLEPALRQRLNAWRQARAP